MRERAVVRHRHVRHGAVGGLEADCTAEGRGHADRAGSVGADVEGPASGAGQGSGAGGRAARRPPVHPGVVRRAGQRAVADGRPPLLGERRRAHDDRAGSAHAGHQRSVLARGGGVREPGPTSGRQAGHGLDVLDRHRDAVQGAELVAAHDGVGRQPRLLPGSVRVEVDERVEVGLPLLDAREERLGDLERRPLATAHPGRDVDGGGGGGVGGHGRTLVRTRVGSLAVEGGSMSATLQASRVAAGHGDRKLFDGLDLVVAPGDVVGLVGPNGAGKTTLLRILAGERPPDAGTVTVSPATAHIGYLRAGARAPRRASPCARTWPDAPASPPRRPSSIARRTRSPTRCPGPTTPTPRRSSRGWRWAAPTSTSGSRRWSTTSASTSTSTCR